MHESEKFDNSDIFKHVLEQARKLNSQSTATRRYTTCNWQGTTAPRLVRIDGDVPIHGLAKPYVRKIIRVFGHAAIGTCGIVDAIDARTNRSPIPILDNVKNWVQY